MNPQMGRDASHANCTLMPIIINQRISTLSIPFRLLKTTIKYPTIRIKAITPCREPVACEMEISAKPEPKF